MVQKMNKDEYEFVVVMHSECLEILKDRPEIPEPNKYSSRTSYLILKNKPDIKEEIGCIEVFKYKSENDISGKLFTLLQILEILYD